MLPRARIGALIGAFPLLLSRCREVPDAPSRSTGYSPVSFYHSGCLRHYQQRHERRSRPESNRLTEPGTAGRSVKVEATIGC
jgi:hypothetical protein